MEKLNLMAIKAKMFTESAKEKARNKANEVKSTLNEGVQGAFAFEYVIVLVVMVAVILVAWAILGDAVEAKAQEIAGWMAGSDVGPGVRP